MYLRQPTKSTVPWSIKGEKKAAPPLSRNGDPHMNLAATAAHSETKWKPVVIDSCRFSAVSTMAVNFLPWHAGSRVYTHTRLWWLPKKKKRNERKRGKKKRKRKKTSFEPNARLNIVYHGVTPCLTLFIYSTHLSISATPTPPPQICRQVLHSM